MLCMSFFPERRNDAQKRFIETGAMPPSPVTMRERWHSVEGQRGFVIAESSDAVAIAKWFQDWTDLLSFEITPVLNDEEFTQVIS